jgi:hypothetical protein
MNPRAVLIVLALTCVIDGILDSYFGERHSRTLLVEHALAIGVLCYVWCRADAASRGVSPDGALFAGIFPLFGIPVYLFRTRSGRARWISNGKALALLFGSSLLTAVTSEVVSAVRT